MKIFWLPVFFFAVWGCGVSAQVGTSGQARKMERPSPTSEPIIHFHDAPLNSVLQLYRIITGRTVLHPVLPAKFFTLDAFTTNQAEVAAILANALKEKRLVSILDGDKFVRVIPDSWKDTAPMLSTQVISSKAKSVTSTNKSETIIIAGQIDLPAVPIRQALQFYAELVKAKGFENDATYSSLPPQMISFVSQTPLTKADVVYAFDTLFNWSGFKVTPSTNQLLRVIRLSQP